MAAAAAAAAAHRRRRRLLRRSALPPVAAATAAFALLLPLLMLASSPRPCRAFAVPPRRGGGGRFSSPAAAAVGGTTGGVRPSAAAAAAAAPRAPLARAVAAATGGAGGASRGQGLRASGPNGDDDGGMPPASSDEERLDQLLRAEDLRSAVRHLRSHPDLKIDRERFLRIFESVETRTSEAEENDINTRRRTMEEMAYPPVSPARTEMTDMYRTLRDVGRLRLFGAAGRDGRPYPAMGSRDLTPTLLERITDLSMVSLTPEPTNTLLYGGVALCLLEGVVSLYTGIDLNFLVLSTLILAFLDRFLVNGAVFETAMRILMPEYGRRILRHEAGHFLCAYLLGCPVEGCVLSSWAALQDSRFGGRRTSVSAGTSFFDPELSDEINGRAALSRDSIDRYSVIVMGGIAAEALEFGRADGGAGDEMALVRFLTSVSPRGGGARIWSAERIKNQARWGAAQAVLLLREYRECYDALVDALERGGGLGECVWSIEDAARTKGVEPMKEPLGYILDEGLYGEWATTPPAVEGSGSVGDPSSVPAVMNRMPREKPSAQSTPDSDVESTREALSQYRQMMEEKLKKIDERLGEIDKGSGS